MPSETAILTYENLNDAQKKALDAHITAMDTDYDCCDNDRLAIAGDINSVADYEQTRARGRCGFYDVEIPCEDGTTILYGLKSRAGGHGIPPGVYLFCAINNHNFKNAAT